MIKIKLLVVIGNEIFRDGLVRLLEHDPKIEIVYSCGTVLEAIESTNEHQPDVVLLSTCLPHCSGVEALRRIHDSLPNTKIVVVTCSEVNSDFLVTVKAGASACISNYISFENLIKAIALVAEGKLIVSPSITTRTLAEINSLDDQHNSAEKVDGFHLSKREQAVLSLVAEGFTNSEIATKLFLSEHTVKVHLRNIMGKSNAHTRQQAVFLWREKKRYPVHIAD